LHTAIEIISDPKNSWLTRHVRCEFREYLGILGAFHSRIGTKTVDPGEDVCYLLLNLFPVNSSTGDQNLGRKLPISALSPLLI